MRFLKNNFFLSLFAILLAACGPSTGEAPLPGNVSPTKTGKTDNPSSSSLTITLCNEGDMVIAADPDHPGQFLVKITDQDVIDWFEARSKESACGLSYDGGQACVDKQLPWYVTIGPDPEDPQLQLMVIEDLKDHGGGRYLTSEPGTEARARDGGYDLTINGMKMPNSHTNIRYEVGHWFFERCGAPTLPAEPLVSCNEGAMKIAADPNLAEQYLLTITNQGVIDWFEARSEEPACGPSYHGGQTCVDKQLPWYVAIGPDPEDPQLRLMVIEDLKDYGDGRYLTSEPGTEARARDGGYDLTINGMKMPNSHTNIRYEVGSWFFERCTTL